MSDYSFVKDNNGDIVGFWFRDPGVVTDQDRLSMLVIAALMKVGIPDSITRVISAGILGGVYRVVPNKYDGSGGCFVMLADARAPGEASTRKPWWKFW